jgi:gliding motility-associated-like protein
MECPESVTISNDLDDCGAVFTYDTPYAEDNCAVIVTELTSGLESGSVFPLGTTTVTWSFEDEAGNITLCTFDVTVEDTQAPAIACPNDIVVDNEVGLCGAFVSFDLPQVVDNCDLLDPVMTNGIPSGELFPVGVTIITFEVSDPSGNVSTCSFTVTLKDTEAPVVFCPGDMEQIDPLVEYETPYFTDNCYSDLILVEGYPSGTEFPHGYTEVVYAAVDLAGNADTCSFTVLINTPPIGVDDVADHYEEDDEIVIDPISNDIDVDGDDLTLSDAIAGNGTVEIVNNALIYEPIGDWCGRDTITYVLCDPFMACDTAIIVVDVECFIDLIIPEGFSPNNDGTNDTFQILGLEDYPGNRLSVYNRWGHLVYEAYEYQSDWEGKSQDTMTLGNGLLPEGTYFFVLELGDVPIKPVKGYVYLNR